MIIETLLGPFLKGISMTVGYSLLAYSGFKYFQTKNSPELIEEILENITEKSFREKDSLVSKEKIGKSCTRYKYKIPVGTSLAEVLKAKPAIEETLNCECDVWVEEGNFVFELRFNKLPAELFYKDVNIQEILKKYECGMYLGESREGAVVIDFTNNATPHLLFGGPTGSGKSNLINQGICGMVERYSYEELNLILIDLKDGVELGDYQDLPHVREFYETVEQAEEGLDNIVLEIQKRNFLFKQMKGVKKLSDYNKKSKEKLPRILIIADEFAQFNNIGETDTRKRIYKKWETILQKGRSAGIHCMLGTQVADADIFPKQIKGNVDARFGFKFKDVQHSKMISGGNELTRLPNIQGRGIFVLGERYTQTQVPYISEVDIRRVLEKFKTQKEIPYEEKEKPHTGIEHLLMEEQEFELMRMRG